MAVKPIKIKQSIDKVTIGAKLDEGGTRASSISIGGEEALPFIFSMGDIPHRPVIAYEFWDTYPRSWNPHLLKDVEEYANDPVSWARFLVENYNSDLLFLRLMGFHPEYDNKDPRKVTGLLKDILDKISTPLIVVGCGDAETDNRTLPLAAEAAAGEKLLIGNATAENYRQITKACVDHGHSLITESPIDINIAKQVNILVTDAGLPGDRIVMYATTGALGYGLEYAYSIMEKSRLVGLEGDKYMNKPQAAFVGQETWRIRESLTGKKMGITWEVMTGVAYLQAGADLLVVRHPESGKKLQKYVDGYFQ